LILVLQIRVLIYKIQALIHFRSNLKINFFKLETIIIIMNKKLAEEYWKKNIKYLIILLSIWFTVSFGFGIILVEELNQFKIGGFKLGFWFAQQGSIYVFVALILVYILLMNRLDKKFNSKRSS
jgi:putative solute:sodium symporter small subunit